MLQELTGSKNIKLKPQIDESLIAGFIVKYGSSEIDLSVKGQLNKISNELVSDRADFCNCKYAAACMPPCITRLQQRQQDAWHNVGSGTLAGAVVQVEAAT